MKKLLVWPLIGIGLLAGAIARGAVTFGGVTLTGVMPRIITPNGDGANDKVRFTFDNPEMLPVGGVVYDINGARVASLRPGSEPTEVLLWDGKDDSGQTVPGGIYVYQLDFKGKYASGTVAVAR